MDSFHRISHFHICLCFLFMMTLITVTQYIMGTHNQPSITIFSRYHHSSMTLEPVLLNDPCYKHIYLINMYQNGIISTKKQENNGSWIIFILVSNLLRIGCVIFQWLPFESNVGYTCVRNSISKPPTLEPINPYQPTCSSTG